MKVFEKIVGSTIKEEVYRNLKEAIIKGKLKPGNTLVEMDIAREMSISRAPIREVLNKLEQERFVVSVPRKGYYVAPITQKSVREIYETRMLMEPYAVRMTIDKIQLEEIEDVEKLIEELSEDMENFEKYTMADKGLHKLLYKHLSNEYIKNIMISMEDHSMRTRYSESYEGLKREEVEATIKEHFEIIDAIRRRNPDDAATAIYTHIVNGEKRTLDPIISQDE